MLTTDLTPVRNFICEELLYGGFFDDDTNLIEAGVIDSMSLLRLIFFLESCYHIEVPLDDLDPDNFRSVRAMEAFLSHTD